jgi:hypothetical protein
MESPYTLYVYSQCNAADRFEKWKSDGGTLENNVNIGCGINALTFIGVFSRSTGKKLVRELMDTSEQAPSTGTSFLKMMQFVADFSKNGTKLTEVITNVTTFHQMEQFIMNVDASIGLNSCMIVKFNRSNTGEVAGHSFLFSKDNAGVLWVVDPQTVHMKPLTPDNIRKFYDKWSKTNIISASVIMFPTESKTRRKVFARPIDRMLDTSWPIQLSKEDINSFKTTHLLTPIQILPNRIVFNEVVRANANRVWHSLPAVPITVPFDFDKQNSDWNQVICTTNTACTEHAMSILKILPPEQYEEMVIWQNEQKRGQNTDAVGVYVKNALAHTKHNYKFIRVALLDISSPDGKGVDINKLKMVWDHIPSGSGAPVVIYPPNKNSGHAVVFAKNNANQPILIDGTLRTFYASFATIVEYINSSSFTGRLELLVHVQQGTKRTYSQLKSKSPDSDTSMSRKRKHTRNVSPFVGPSKFNIGTHKTTNNNANIRRTRKSKPNPPTK